MTQSEHLERLRELTGTHLDLRSIHAIVWAIRTIEELRARVAELESQERTKVGNAIEIIKKAEETCGANFIEEFMQQEATLAGERKTREEAELKLDQRLVCANDHCIHTGTVHDRCETRGETSQAEEIQWLREAVWMLYQIHGGKYTEPTYTEALESVRRALKRKP